MSSGPILLIDDEPAVLEFYRHMLEDRGLNVLAVLRGDDAIDVIHRELPALVISDILMGEMTGFELCDKLRRANEKRMPFLFLAANDGYGVLRDGLGVGGDDFLVKGVDPDFLEERVRFWLRTPLSGLLPGARLQAQKLAAKYADSAVEASPIAELGVLREDLKLAALELGRTAFEETGGDSLQFGDVPQSFLGFVAGVVERLCADDLAALLRSADLFDYVLGSLNPMWMRSARQIFADTEGMAAYDLFQAAARTGEIRAAAYLKKL